LRWWGCVLHTPISFNTYHKNKPKKQGLPRTYYLLNNKEIKLIALIIFYSLLVGAVEEEELKLREKTVFPVFTIQKLARPILLTNIFSTKYIIAAAFIFYPFYFLF